VDPTGKFAYAVNHGGSTVWGYAVNAVTGALTPIAGSPFAVGGTARSVAVDPSGKFAYITSSNGGGGGGGISGFTISATTGALTPIGGSPFDSKCTGDPYAFYGCNFVAVDPSGKLAYAVDFYDPSNTGSLDGDVYGNTINGATGALTPISGLPFPVGQFLTSIAVSGQIH
jgi:hypothetical protein